MAMKTKTTKTKKSVKPVHKSGKNDQKEFPGYPPYDASEDIMKKGERIDADLESAKVDPPTNTTGRRNPGPRPLSDNADIAPSIDTEEDEEMINKDQFAVTDEDLEALGPEDLSLDMGEDEELKHRARPVDFTAKGLDIPGSELDDAAESTGSEDEENNSYSIGGDDHNNLEENKGE
jgi:hypothetical protein